MVGCSEFRWPLASLGPDSTLSTPVNEVKKDQKEALVLEGRVRNNEYLNLLGLHLRYGKEEV